MAARFKRTPGTISRYDLARVALGEIDADLAIVNGDVVNVYTGEILSQNTILVYGDRIAYAGKHSRYGIGPKSTVVDASGRTVIPGLIDGHTHTDYIYASHELARYALLTGTTTIVTDVVELTFALGYPGFREFLRSVRHQPVRFFATIPPMVSISPVAASHALTASQNRRLLREPDIVGLGEIYWRPLLSGDRRALDLADKALESGKTVDGHGAGASGAKLQAYAALGITSDHEPITTEEVIERLRLGMSVMIREGEVRRDLAAVSAIKDRFLDFRRLGVSTDGIGPIQLTSQGFMNWLVQETIDLGFPPVQAIQMATLNVAERFGLSQMLGGIAPGRFADIVIIPELRNIKPEVVIAGGRLAVADATLKVSPRVHRYHPFTYESVRLPREFTAREFDVRCDSRETTVRLRVIDQVTNLLTREAILSLAVSGGRVLAEPTNDILKVAAIERYYDPGKMFTGFIRGTGLRIGAIATSTCWDSSDLIVVGASERDMAFAVNRIRELQGGFVVCLNGRVMAETPLPVGGMISTEPMEKLADQLLACQKASENLGFKSPDVRTTISVLTTGAIPYVRICESGLFNLKTNSLVEMIVSEPA